MTAQQNKDLVVGALEAAVAGDIDRFLEALHPDIEVHEPTYLPYTGTYHGRDGFMALLGEATKLIDLSTVNVLSATADDERVVLLMAVELVDGHDQMLITEHWQIEDGLVRDVRVFWYGLPKTA